MEEEKFLYTGNCAITAGKIKARIAIKPQKINPIIAKNLPHFADSVK